ncbi:tRNA (adenine(22)-N(1))-methyltransferase [Candidatus Hepatoplasma crinochetorum Av]|jgi:tRNA (adenine22-N1)-methyltransferase|uniref:tRNA (Adenine(22)-N(1))-methyltransferase n=1 Tax=Candidatus Hepatoplasma crinochetorum Av TaxID=1427984 RepID=W8GJN9_9MOLU|nr:class I SAM-dependent methyltransferase [Candidatus Hepatoplasma crinochetorum]AHK22437.1 tRNA (adenine(22)-N(1))-methyltransferase [Candidatus Hepatoplasma crinochetorum Av]
MFKGRIIEIADYISKNSQVLDIGTDHGYIPLYLLKNKITDKITATDINTKPLLQAKKTLIDYKDLETLKFIKSNGFENIIDIASYQYIIIAGLGGKTIEIILKNYNDNAILILNPTNNEAILRKFLYDNKFKIEDEKLIYENNIYSIIIKAKKQYKVLKYNQRDLVLGPILIKKNNKVISQFFYQKGIYFQNIFLKSKKEEHKELAKIYLSNKLK